MMLKLLSPDNPLELDNDDPGRGCTILDDVQKVKLSVLDTGERSLAVQYRVLHRGNESESFIVNAPVFLMNDNGKTIQSFLPGKFQDVAGEPIWRVDALDIRLSSDQNRIVDEARLAKGVLQIPYGGTFAQEDIIRLIDLGVIAQGSRDGRLVYELVRFKKL